MNCRDHHHCTAPCVGCGLDANRLVRVGHGGFPPIRSQIEKGVDMIKRPRQQRMSLEPDVKRRLINPREVVVLSRGITHLAADTVPWSTVSEFITARATLERFREERAMKTVADFQAFDLMLVEALARSDARCLGRGVLNSSKDGALGKLRRAFLRAVAQEVVGVPIKMSGPVLAETLSKLGVATTVNHVKDAGRPSAQLIHHSVPRTPEVMVACAALVEAFPGADVEQFLIPIDR